MNESVRVDVSGDGIVWVRLRGSVILVGPQHVLSQISRALDTGDVTAVRLELSEATSMDSSGVAVIVLARQLALRAGVGFSMDSVRPEILEQLRIVGVAQLLDVTARPPDGHGPVGPGPGRPRVGVLQIVAADFDESNVEPLRQSLATYAATCGLGELERYKFVLAATEMMVNSVLHGGGRGRLRAWRQDGDLWVEVSDNGPGIPAHIRDASGPQQTGAVPTSGLWLVRKICSAVTIDSGPGGTTVRIRYPLPQTYDD